MASESRLGPDQERIVYKDYMDREKEAKAFWLTINGSHGFKHWQSASMFYWNLVKGEFDG